MNRQTTLALTILAAGTSFAFTGPVSAETIAMKAKLTGAAEVPATTSSGSGNATVTFDTATKVLTWKMDYSGLSGPATAAHFHGPAEAGKNAGVAVPVTLTPTGSEGKATLNDAQAADLMAGKYYLNVHTAANPGGEIRGQVTK